MDPARNPYNPGAGAPPPALVGREHAIEAFDIAVRRFGLGRSARSMLLTGLRGVGKTVLLREFGRIGERSRWVYQRIEATEDLRFPETLAILVRKAILRLSIGERVAERARRARGVLKSFQVRWELPVNGDIVAGFDPVPGYADSGELDHDLADLFIEVGELAKARGVGVLFTIDEMQYLSRRHLKALIVGLHSISQEQLPFVVAGAGLPSLLALVGDARSYAERLFEFRVINSLKADEATTALVEPAQAEGVRWHPDALERVVTRTRGYPYFLQEFGKQVWNIAEGPEEITPTDVDAAIPIATDELDTGFFRVRIDRTTDTERTYLSAIASLGAGPYASGEVAAAMGKTTGQVGPHRDALIKRGLCYSPRHGIIDFTVPMFDRFISRRMT